VPTNYESALAVSFDSGLVLAIQVAPGRVGLAGTAVALADSTSGTSTGTRSLPDHRLPVLQVEPASDSASESAAAGPTQLARVTPARVPPASPILTVTTRTSTTTSSSATSSTTQDTSTVPGLVSARATALAGQCQCHWPGQ
jgi:hypothetical protein